MVPTSTAESLHLCCATADQSAVRLQKRIARASTIHGLAGMAAIMASTYKAYLGEGLPQPLNGWLQRFKIPHPGRVGVVTLDG